MNSVSEGGGSGDSHPKRAGGQLLTAAEKLKKEEVTRGFPKAQQSTVAAHAAHRNTPHHTPAIRIKVTWKPQSLRQQCVSYRVNCSHVKTGKSE